MRSVFLLTVLFAVCGCGAIRGYGPENPKGNARITVSPNYQYVKGQKIVVMPFEATGSNVSQTDTGASNIFMAEVMRRNLFTVLDLSWLELYGMSDNNGGKHVGTLTMEQLSRLNSEYGVDLVFYGTVNYLYRPGVYKKENKAGEKEPESYYREGGYVIASESFKAVSTYTGEVVITSYVDSEYGKSQIYELVYAIEKAAYGYGR